MTYSYLACPYSHPDPTIMAMRYVEICGAMDKLIECRIVAYSPIQHFHYHAAIYGRRTDAEFWDFHNEVMLKNSNRLIIRTLAGWQESKGVGKEIKWSREISLPIFHMDDHGRLWDMDR